MLSIQDDAIIVLGLSRALHIVSYLSFKTFARREETFMDFVACDPAMKVFSVKINAHFLLICHSESFLTSF